MDYVPITRSTRDLCESIMDKAEAMSRLDELTADARGWAHDGRNAVRVTVDARGKLLDLKLTHDALTYGEDLGSVIREVAELAQRFAIQDSYNRAAPVLGDETMLMIETLSGVRAPARRADDDGRGITAVEFQRRRAARHTRGV